MFSDIPYSKWISFFCLFGGCVAIPSCAQCLSLALFRNHFWRYLVVPGIEPRCPICCTLRGPFFDLSVGFTWMVGVSNCRRSCLIICFISIFIIFSLFVFMTPVFVIDVMCEDCIVKLSTKNEMKGFYTVILRWLKQNFRRSVGTYQHRLEELKSQSVKVTLCLELLKALVEIERIWIEISCTSALSEKLSHKFLVSSWATLMGEAQSLAF